MMNMQRRIVLMVVLSVTICISEGCTQYATKKIMRYFFKSEITFPETLCRIENRNVVYDNLVTDSLPKLIIYNDYRECNSCKIKQLTTIESVYKLSDSLGTFEVVAIFSPSTDEFDDVMEELITMNFKYPVYVDVFGDFGKLNKCIPEDKRFHCFLVNRDNKPVFVGNPAIRELRCLFLDVLKNQ